MSRATSDIEQAPGHLTMTQQLAKPLLCLKRPDRFETPIVAIIDNNGSGWRSPYLLVVHRPRGLGRRPKLGIEKLALLAPQHLVAVVEEGTAGLATPAHRATTHGLKSVSAKR